MERLAEQYKGKTEYPKRPFIQSVASPLGDRHLVSRYSQGGRTRSVFVQRFRALFYSLRRRAIYLSLYKNIFVSEVRNLLPRIRYRMSKKTFGGGIELGNLFRMSSEGYLEPNTRTQSRIRSTQCMLSNHAWATPTEIEIFLTGWDDGAKWAYEDFHNSCSRQLERENQ